MVRSHIVAVLLFAVFSLIVAGCSETPNQVGSKLLPNQDLLHIDTTSFFATSSTSQPVINATSGATRVLIGKLGTTESWGLIRFSSLPDSIKTMTFVSAQLNLRTIYHFGDSLGAFSAVAHNVLMYWATDSLTIDSLKAPGFYDTRSSGSASFGSVGDTVTIAIPLDTAMIRTWGTVSDTTDTNFGVLIQPTNSAVIKGFGSFIQGDATLWPQLLLIFQGAGGTVDSLIVNTGANRYVATGPAPNWPSDSTHIYVQNGFAYRGAVDFDVSALPSHAAVHKATLELTYDPSLSRTNSFTLDSLWVFFVADDGTTLTYIEALSATAQVGTSKVYQFPVGPLVQRWLRGAVSRRLVIAGFDESSALDLFSLYGAGARQGLKPKLTVYHTLFQ